MAVNVELLRKTMNQIVQHPESWNQSQWHCKTSHCFAGWGQILCGKAANPVTCADEMQVEFGLDAETMRWVYAGDRTMSELHAFVSATIKGEDYFALAGYDRAGYDRAGRDRAGRDRDGYDRAGRDRAGYDRAGRDRAGRDRDGRDRAGNGLPLL